MATTMERARPETTPDPPAAQRRASARSCSPPCASPSCSSSPGVSMLAVGLPGVGEDLGLSQTSLTWVADAYALTLASLLLFAGALGDRYGRRGALLVGIVLFGGGSLLSAFADSGGAAHRLPGRSPASAAR